MNDKVFGLTCNHATDPRGLDSHPTFSWKYAPDTGRQSAYRIGVASTRDNLANAVYDCWDSGRVEAAQSHNVTYSGDTLAPRTTYYWSVTVYDESDEGFSKQAEFETGKRDEPWSARWIAADHHKKHDESLDAPYLRKSFSVKHRPLRARLYICSPGYFDAYVNGKRVSDEELPTPFTRFDSRLLYCTYDVTDHLQETDNAIGVLIGNGWYNCFTEDVWNSKQASWRHIPKLIAELHTEYEDGSHEIVKTDSSWKSAPSPIVFNGIRNGEHFDARMIQEGWDTPAFDDSEWSSAKVTRPAGGLLEAMEMEPIRITERIEPVRSWRTEEGAYVFDTGQNMAGTAEITVEGSAGDEIIIKYSEMLQEDEVNINQRTVSGFVRSGEFQTDRYILSGIGKETWRPRFVYHGFQYIEVSGCKTEPLVTALQINTDAADSGSLSSENATINSIQHATRWSTLTNLHGLPTDDPHREKNAWTGDVSVSAEQMLLNFHTTPLLRKWLGDIRDAQKPDGALPCVVPSTGWGYNWGNGPDWSSALTHIPWMIYLYTGDTRILTENYEAITRHFGYMESMAEDGIVHYGIGDWCAPFEGRAIAVNMASFKAPTALTDTAYYYNAADTIVRMAAVLGLEEDAVRYRKAADAIKQAFRTAFYDPTAHRVAGDCQTATACMIYQGLHNDDEHAPLLNLLLQQISDTDDHQDTGILGNKYIYNVLGDAGRMDIAMKMVLNDSFPSFKHWMDRGATTLWECWNGEGSQNHHMFSDVTASMYKYLGGIRPDEDEPGFGHILMRPAVDCGIRSVAASHDSPYGTISSRWERSGNSVTLNIDIPGGSRAALELPTVFASDSYPHELLPGTHRIEVQSE